VTAKIIYKNERKVIIEWSEGIEFGCIAIKYQIHGIYSINAEYIGIDRLLEILSKIKL